MTHELLRFSTAGSVDDGKSTLIGRLLLDSKAIFDDQLHAVTKSTERRGREGVDLALVTDGLIAEREQGITIDVAYRYFATPKRKFIIADTPGHEQYTRNMITGASTAEAALILADASRGLTAQSRRHAFLSQLLGIRHLIVCVNKMDLVGFSADVFHAIAKELRDYVAKLAVRDLTFIPISALHGDNVVTASANMPWYQGPPLLHILENLDVDITHADGQLRFPVQIVNRPNTDYRGYCGTVFGGVVKPGQEVLVLPGGRKTRVTAIATIDGDLGEATPPMSVALKLVDDIDISRGDVICGVNDPPQITQTFTANLCWLAEEPLNLKRRYLIKHGYRTLKAMITAITHRVDINTQAHDPAAELCLNEIAEVEITTMQPIIADAYAQNRLMGCFIVIDETTNNTMGAGMLT